MKAIELLNPYTLGTIELNNRVVMAPMTRSRAIGNIPNALMVEFYGQRAAAGLIITEGTSPSPNGLGYCRIPGIFNNEQVEGWKKITHEVHEKNGKIFLQLMHTGRISHSANMMENAMIFAPSALQPKGKMWTDTLGPQEYPVPHAMDLEEINRTKREFCTAAANAIQAGFDGVELHGANGYLLEQFLSPHSNKRNDDYGGTIENRCRFLLETVKEVVETVGKEKVGIRLSPYGIASDMSHYPEIESTYKDISGELNRIGILYINIVDHSGMGAPAVPVEIKKEIRKRFQGAVILGGGYTKERAETELKGGLADLIAFGRPFINNPDLVERFENGWPISKDLDADTFYTSGEKGYTDYPVFAELLPQPI